MRTLTAITLALTLAACADDGGTPCPPDVAAFEADVWRPVLENRCNICHNPAGLARRSRFVLSAPGSASGAMGDNLAAAARMARTTEDGQPLLLRRPLGVDHPGGALVSEGSPEHQALVAFVGQVRGDATACAAAGPVCTPGAPGPRLLRRLSRAEYDNTLTALFDVDARYAPALVADVVVAGFDNNARALEVSPLLAEQLRQAAEEVAATVAARPALACSGDGAACARAWLTDAELDRWLAVYAVGQASPEQGVAAHVSGMALMIGGLLQSPAFLYRSEVGELAADGTYPLTSYELASELSYFLWAAPPDDELWQAAVADQLRDPAVIAAQARRMLASPRARASLDRFAGQWLDVERLATVAKDPMTYPELTPTVRAAMTEELYQRVARVVQGGGTLADLLTGPTTFVDAPLAQYYGLPAPTTVDAHGFGAVDASARGGLLASGAVLTVHARANSSSPIHRGKLVRERLLCQALPPPPPGVNAQPPALDPTLTTRERYAAHSQLITCSGCHALMDPIGFGFETFDGIGRARATEGGRPIDDSGEIRGSVSSDGAFVGVGGLEAHLAAQPEVAACFSTEWLRWATGQDDRARLDCLSAELATAVGGGSHGIDELIVAITQTAHFRVRAAAVAGSGTGTGTGTGTGSGSGSGTGTGTGTGTGSGSGSGTGTGTGTGTGLGEADTPGVTATVERTDAWPTGYCAKLLVQNVSTAPVTWRVTVTVEGTINNYWNAQVTTSGSRATFTGAPYNATVAPGATAEAGFCAAL